MYPKLLLFSYLLGYVAEDEDLVLEPLVVVCVLLVDGTGDLVDLGQLKGEPVNLISFVHH